MWNAVELDSFNQRVKISDEDRDVSRISASESRKSKGRKSAVELEDEQVELINILNPVDKPSQEIKEEAKLRKSLVVKPRSQSKKSHSQACFLARMVNRTILKRNSALWSQIILNMSQKQPSMMQYCLQNTI
jgi:hypothetical protein